MNKKLLTLAMAVVFTVSVAGVSMAAKKVTCTVDSVAGDKVALTCKKADKLKAGDKVSVKKKKAKAIEGC